MNLYTCDVHLSLFNAAFCKTFLAVCVSCVMWWSNLNIYAEQHTLFTFEFKLMPIHQVGLVTLLRVAEVRMCMNKHAYAQVQTVVETKIYAIWESWVIASA